MHFPLRQLPEASAGTAASQATELRRGKELLAATGTWVCPECTYGNHVALRNGCRVVLRECDWCGTAKPARPGDWAVLVSNDRWIGHVVLVLGPNSNSN